MQLSPLHILIKQYLTLPVGYFYYKKKLLKRIPKDLPVFFVSGKEDPVGDFSKGVIAASNSLKAVGMKNISVKLYENDRHEILNETDREKVYEDLLLWLTKYSSKR